jgi:DNA mismatch endonuclease, patch repair protein
MADVFSKEKRSWVMSRIRSKGTKIESSVENILVSRGIRFEKHYNIIGKPDFVINETKWAIFVDGDFWHGYRMGPRRLSAKPKLWREKILSNKKRDRKINGKLKRMGWKVIRIWEHEIEKTPESVSRKLAL